MVLHSIGGKESRTALTMPGIIIGVAYDVISAFFILRESMIRFLSVSILLALLNTLLRCRAKICLDKAYFNC